MKTLQFKTSYLLVKLHSYLDFNKCWRPGQKQTTKKSPLAPSKTVVLYHSSGAKRVSAGSSTITAMANGNAQIVINLNNDFRAAGVTFRAYLRENLTGQGNLCADLGMVDGNTGWGMAHPVRMLERGSAIKYIDLIRLSGYEVIVVNGSHLQAQGIL